MRHCQESDGFFQNLRHFKQLQLLELKSVLSVRESICYFDIIEPLQVPSIRLNDVLKARYIL